MSKTCNVSSEDARNVKNSVIFVVIKNWLKSSYLTAKHMEGVCKYFINKIETPSFFAVFEAI